MNTFMTQVQTVQHASYTNLTGGDPAPWFRGPTNEKPDVHISGCGGRFSVLGFFGDPTDQDGQSALETIRQCRQFFDDPKTTFYGVSWATSDGDQDLLKNELPGIQYFLDKDGDISRLYGVLPLELPFADAVRYPRRRWFVLDPQLRVVGIFPFQADGAERDALTKFLSVLPSPDLFAGFELPVPIMAIPYVLEPSLCRRMIDLYETHGGVRTGVMREIDGRSVNIITESIKKRMDHNIKDPAILQMLRDRIARRVFPEIEKVHFMKCTRSERYIIGCYDAEDGGFFRPHRDNQSKGSAHRRFAVSINLNDDFEGGELNFPEFGAKWFKMPPGTAVIFSAPLMHQVSPVTRGRRYAFLPFVYDDKGAEIREANIKFVNDGTKKYHAYGDDSTHDENPSSN
jgi:predicted 2-oxoglutarate/Fe(II)-dependent dioxygenase YbiX/peroxiredoxin